jgi:hypothetical protein
MAAFRKKLRGMKFRADISWRAAGLPPLALLMLIGTGTPALPADVPPMGSGTNLSLVMYFEPPDEQKVKVRMSSAEMTPLPGATYDVKTLKIEKFSLTGRLEAVVQAPACTYSPLDAVASSPGPLALTLDDGKIHVAGEGFLWQQNDTTLIISNRVRTVINMGNWKLTTP